MAVFGSVDGLVKVGFTSSQGVRFDLVSSVWRCGLFGYG